MTISGTWYIMPTAFGPDGSLDLASQRELAETVVAWGADGITVLGVMGEASTLTFTERADVIDAVVAGAPGVPLAVGCSGPAVHAVTANARQAAERGASLAMVSAPQLLRDVDVLPGFMGSVAAQTDLQLIIQDEPAATGVGMPVSILTQCLVASGASVVKLEDPPTPNKITKLLAAAPGTAIFGGLGGAAAYFELRRGAVGTMTGFSYPEILKELRQLHEAGDSAAAFALYVRYLPLIAFEATPIVGLGIRKELLHRRGALRSSTMRVAGPPTPELLEELDQVLAAADLRPARRALAIA